MGFERVIMRDVIFVLLNYKLQAGASVQTGTILHRFYF